MKTQHRIFCERVSASINRCVCDYLSEQLSERCTVKERLCVFLQKQLVKSKGSRGSKSSSSFYTNEVFNIFDKKDDVVAAIVVEKNKISRISCSVEENPTYVVHVEDEDILRQIFESETPMDTFHEKQAKGEISVEGQGVIRGVATAVINTGLRIVSWLG